MPYEIEIDPQKQNYIIAVKLMKDEKIIRHVKLPLTATKEEIEAAGTDLINEQEAKDLEEPPEPTPEEIAEQEAIVAVIESCVDVIQIGEKEHKVKKKYCKIAEPIEVPIEPEQIIKTKK
jgi:hypothetical protein